MSISVSEELFRFCRSGDTRPDHIGGKLPLEGVESLVDDAHFPVSYTHLSLLFVFVGTRMLGQRNSLTFWTLLIAHITFNLPYVILNVMPKLKQTDSSLRDAAMDLGCTPLQAFFKVTLHEIAPGIVSGAIMAFTMSLDDFVISYFVSGLDFVTLPVEIYSYTKKPLHPKIYALFTLLFLLILVLMVTMNLIQLRGDKKRAAAHSGV